LAVSFAASSALAENATVEMIEGSPSDINTWAFTPPDVTISAGDTVTWTNVGQQPHTATATGGQFDTGNVGPGQSKAVTLSAPGTFAYQCTPHPWMKGTITVLAAAAAPAAQPAPPTPAPAPPAAAAPPPAAPAPAQAVPTPTPFRFLTPTPAARPTTAGATTTAPRAGGFPIELAAPLLAGGASALGGGLYLLRRRPRSD
jgi:plastocyanin